ncbi:MAG: hypothetical protein ACTSUG_13425 [Candidatus Helarchaeota archaeon]
MSEEPNRKREHIEKYIFLIISIIFPIFVSLYKGFVVSNVVNWGIGAAVGFILIHMLEKLFSKKIRMLIWIIIFLPYVAISAILKLNVLMINFGFIFGITISAIINKKGSKLK